MESDGKQRCVVRMKAPSTESTKKTTATSFKENYSYCANQTLEFYNVSQNSLQDRKSGMNAFTHAHKSTVYFSLLLLTK